MDFLKSGEVMVYCPECGYVQGGFQGENKPCEWCGEKFSINDNKAERD